MNNSKYLMIEKLGLSIATLVGVIRTLDGKPEDRAVSASDLEALLTKAPRMYGNANKDNNRGPNGVGWTQYEDKSIDTHTAILLNVESIEKRVTEQELKQAIYFHHMRSSNDTKELLEKILIYGYENTTKVEGKE